MANTAKKEKKRNISKYNPSLSLDKLTELREDVDAFEIFVNRFLKPTYSKKWNYHVNYKRSEVKKIANIVSITDEAFVLLVLENNWDRWIDINNQSDNNYIPSKRGRSKPTTSSVMPKYTQLQVSGSISEQNQDNICKGWRQSGIQRFNELCVLVKCNREEFGEVDASLLEKMNPKNSPEYVKRQAKRQRTSMTVKPFVEDEEDDSSGSESDE